MRYTLSELASIATAKGEFPTGDTGVTIDLYNTATGASVTLDDDACTEIGSTGIYVWKYSNITTTPTAAIEYAYTMTNTDGLVQTGAQVFGGWEDTALSFIKKIFWKHA
jgi:hypothetical protein